MLQGILRRFRILCKAGSVIICVLSVLSLLGRQGLLLELTTHFRVQYFIGALVCCVALLSSGQRRWAQAALMAVFINASVWMLYLPAQPKYPQHNAAAPQSQSLKSIKILQANLYTANAQYDLLFDLIEQESPDLIALQEVNQRWLEHMRVLSAAYPYAKSRPREDNFGIAVYSRYPMDNPGIVVLSDAHVPSIVTGLTLAERTVRLMVTHPVPPMNASYFTHRNQQLKAIAQWTRQSEFTAVVIGDLNVTPWSPFYKQLLKEGHLFQARQGFGWLPTWPTFFPILMIPIDHVLHTTGIHVRSIRAAESIGSDHLPLIVELWIEG